MPIRTIATIAVAVVLGLVAVLLAQNWLGRQRQNDRDAAVLAGTTPVLVAAQPLARGVTLTPQLVREVRFPQGSVPPGALTNVAQLSEGGARMVLRPMAANEPVLSDKVTTPGGKLNLSAAMTEGMRAVTFRSNDVSGVGGFVLPGDRVDVLLTRQAGEEVDSTQTQVLADNVKVLGVDQLADESTDQPTVAKAITIEVTPDQARLIRLAEAVGSVSLALRQVADEAPLGAKVTTVRELAGFAPRRVASAPRSTGAPRPAQGLTVSVTRGIETSSYQLSR